jgi:Ras-related protein Rab-8A
LVGDSNVGKTSFLNRFCYGTYKKKVPCTVGLEYGQKVTRIMENKIIVQLWDTAGQEKFKSLTPSFYRSAMAVVLMFSADNRDSFNSVTLWMKQICSFADEEIPIILVCNKADLIKKQVSEK